MSQAGVAAEVEVEEVVAEEVVAAEYLPEGGTVSHQHCSHCVSVDTGETDLGAADLGVIEDNLESQSGKSATLAPHPPIIILDNLSVTLGQFKALRRVKATIPLKSQTVIIGPNGGGKSTLVQTILGFWPYEGKLTFDPPKPRFGYVPQRLDYDRHLPLTVTEFLALGLTGRPLWLGVSKAVKTQVANGLEKVMAVDLAQRPLGALSGGETQRIMLAAALMSNPDILVLDEPATGVDINGEQLMCELLDGFKRDYTIIMVSHDLPTAKAHSDWVICLNRRVVAQGPPQQVFVPKILAATFGLHQGLELWSNPLV